MVNLNSIMKQAQGMQKKMQEMQEKLEAEQYHGKAGGNLVNITINGSSVLQKIDIDSSLLKPEDKEMLEDLIIAAFNDAKHKADDASKNSMSGALGNMGLPPGFKMPF